MCVFSEILNIQFNSTNNMSHHVSKTASRVGLAYKKLQPFLQHVTLDWLVPGLCTRETKHVSTMTRDRKGTHKLHLNSSVTSWTWTPLEYFVTFYKTVGDKNLILYFDSRMGDQVEGLLILQDCVTITRTVEGADSIIRDLGGDVLSPAAVAVHVSTLHTCHLLLSM